MKIDELILALTEIRQIQGNIDISVYDKNKEKIYPIESLENGNLEIDTSTKLEKAVYKFVDKHEIKSIHVYDFDVEVKLKNGEVRHIQDISTNLTCE